MGIIPLTIRWTGPVTVLAKCFHRVTNTGEKSLVHAHEIQISVISYVGLRTNPSHLLPEQSGEALHLGLVQGKTIVHKYA